MKIVVQVEYRASSSRSKHEGESSFGLCDRLSRTRDNSQRQLPTDQDYAVSTREYQTDQSSLKTAPTAARSVLEKRRKQRQQQTHRFRRLTRSLHIRPRRSSSAVDAQFGITPHKRETGGRGQGQEKDRHSGGPRTAGFYLGHRYQGGSDCQPANSSLRKKQKPSQ